MYKLIIAKKKQDKGFHQYLFTDFESFYEVCRPLTVPLEGRYSIGIESDKVDDIVAFIEREEEYASLLIAIYVPEAIIEYLMMRKPSINVAANIKPFEIFKQIVQEKGLYIEKRALLTLYNSIDHGYTEMSAILSKIADEFEKGTYITEKMLSSLVMLNKIVYPRQVMMSYLRLERFRASQLEKCLACVGNDVAIGAFVKNIKLILEAKAKYFKTGVINGQYRMIDTRNVTCMYRVFVIERHGLNDLTLLLEMYERGLRYDFSEE